MQQDFFISRRIRFLMQLIMLKVVINFRKAFIKEQCQRAKAKEDTVFRFFEILKTLIFVAHNLRLLDKKTLTFTTDA